MRVVSLNIMVKQICGLTESDLTEWESEFVESLHDRTGDGSEVSWLSEKQISVVERIHQKHFA